MAKVAARANVQHTLGTSVSLDGKGVHSDQPVSITLHPAETDYGVRFAVLSNNGEEQEIPAVHTSVGATELCTIIGDPRGTFVATIEHLMAALRALGVDNVRIEIDGAEAPVMDGSSIAFVDAIREAGLLAQAARRTYIKIEKPIRVEMGRSYGELRPYDGCRLDVEIDFENPVIGCQRFECELTAETFVNSIARARTFGFMRDVEKLWAAGYALGSSLENSVVIGEDGVVNPEGLRYRDEFVRHKLLDAIGDLALAGAPIIGEFRSYRGGHKLNFLVLKALFENQDAWSYVRLPGKAPAGAGYGEIAAEPAIALSPAKT